MSEVADESQGSDAGGSGVSTNPNESEAEHESMAIADSEHQQEPGEQAGGGQAGG